MLFHKLSRMYSICLSFVFIPIFSFSLLNFSYSLLTKQKSLPSLLRDERPIICLTRYHSFSWITSCTLPDTGLHLISSPMITVGYSVCSYWKYISFRQQLQGQFQILHSLFRTIQQFSESRILCTLPLLRYLQVKFYHRSRQIVNGFLW